jgi:UDP-glucose 4-epimerase
MLTDGAGYVDSHTAVVPSQAAHEVVLWDKFCNSSVEYLSVLSSSANVYDQLGCLHHDEKHLTMPIT